MIQTPAKSDTSLNQIGKPPDWEPSQVSPLKGAFLFELGNVMWNELLNKRKTKINYSIRPRFEVYHKGKNVKYSHVVWNVHNPDNLIIKGEVIHHKNGNSLDDSIDNLEKMTQSKHAQYHALKNGKAISRQMKERNLKRRRSHCPKGHPYSGDNLRTQEIDGVHGTYIKRTCRTCSIKSSRESNKLRREGRV